MSNLRIRPVVLQQEGRLADISAYVRRLDKIRITGEERETSYLQVPDGQLRWRLRPVDFGTREVQFEGDESRRPVQLLETWPKVTIREAAWIEGVVRNLKSGRAVPPAIDPPVRTDIAEVAASTSRHRSHRSRNETECLSMRVLCLCRSRILGVTT